MPTYLALCNWTSQGMSTIKDAPGRLDAGREVFKAAGAEIKAFYLTMGRYDFAVLIEAPGDEALAQLLLASGAQGNFRTETLKAFSEDEYRKIVASLP
jgi:uncharacterized protein with GYD domain